MDQMTESLESHTKSLSELVEIYAGYSPKPEERRKCGEYLIIGGRNISNGHLTLTWSAPQKGVQL